MDEEDLTIDCDDEVFIYDPKPTNVDHDFLRNCRELARNIINELEIEDIDIGGDSVAYEHCLYCINGATCGLFENTCMCCHDSTCIDAVYYCYDCCIFMGPNCYDRVQRYRDEGQVYNNTVHRCISHNVVFAPAKRSSLCDVCGSDMWLNTLQYYEDGNYEYAVCYKCYKNNRPQYKKLIEVHEDHLFGSIRDWASIVTDDYNNQILCNINKDSPYYKQFAFYACDGHGRVGVFSTKDTDIRALLQEYKETKLFKMRNDDDFNEKLHDDYDTLSGTLDINCKLTIMMLKRNMSTYYG